MIAVVTWATGVSDLKRRIGQATVEEARLLEALPEAQLELLANGVRVSTYVSTYLHLIELVTESRHI